MSEKLTNPSLAAGEMVPSQVGSSKHSLAVSDCYVGIKSCGCMVAWVFDDPKYAKHTAKSVAEFIKKGYSVERANTDEVRHKLGSCKCKQTIAGVRAEVEGER